MIKGFKCKKTERLFKGERVPAFSGFARQADKRLRILDASETLEALNVFETTIITCRAAADNLTDNFKNVTMLNNGISGNMCF